MSDLQRRLKAKLDLARMSNLLTDEELHPLEAVELTQREWATKAEALLARVELRKNPEWERRAYASARGQLAKLSPPRAELSMLAEAVLVLLYMVREHLREGLGFVIQQVTTTSGVDCDQELRLGISLMSGVAVTAKYTRVVGIWSLLQVDTEYPQPVDYRMLGDPP